MKILFLHRNFPAQFKYLAAELAKSGENEVYFITNNFECKNISNIKKYVYKLKRKVPENCHRYLRFYEEAIIHAQAAAEEMIKLKNSGFTPDIIIGHSWGPPLFVKEIYPDVPFIAYLEWYYNEKGADIGFDKQELNIDQKAKLKCKNSHILQDLINCDYGISPTHWQKSQFPKIFQDKITVIHEGINTELCKPAEEVYLEIKDKNLTLTKSDEILTYATRGMEEYRGFPEFMKAVEKLQKARPKLQVIIGGEDRVCYGAKLKNDTFKSKMLRELDLDLSRIHFTGNLPYTEYLKLLQISSVHVYLTYPFVLSWSLLEAMSCGCRIVASDTAPVKELISDNFNGILTDFYDIDKMCIKINNILDNPDKYNHLSINARSTIIEKYGLHTMLKKQIDFIQNCADKNLVKTN